MHAEAYVALICFNKVSIKITPCMQFGKKKKSGNVWMEDGNISIISFLTITLTT